MLRETNPAVLQKIIPIEVDYNAYDLNIDPETLDRIHGEVQVGRLIFEKRLFYKFTIFFPLLYIISIHVRKKIIDSL